MRRTSGRFKWFCNPCARSRGRGSSPVKFDYLEKRVLLSSISGGVFNDINGDGVQQGNEFNIPQQHVWLDLNHDNAWEPGEPAVTTDAAGNYTLGNISPGSYNVCYYAPPGFRQTTPTNGVAAMVTVVGMRQRRQLWGHAQLDRVSPFRQRLQ